MEFLTPYDQQIELIYQLHTFYFLVSVSEFVHTDYNYSLTHHIHGSGAKLICHFLMSTDTGVYLPFNNNTERYLL